VGYTAGKPEQTIIELENTLAHVAQNFNPDLSSNDKKENLTKAKSHLMRLTLDCHKLLWIVIEEDLKKVYDNPLARILCTNLKSQEVESRYYEVKRLAQEARRIEAKNIGVDPLAAIDSYKQVTSKGLELLENIDNGKFLLYKSYSRIISLKRSIIECAIAFIFGVLSIVFYEHLESILTVFHPKP
jgi:hypothetical protein